MSLRQNLPSLSNVQRESYWHECLWEYGDQARIMEFWKFENADHSKEGINWRITLDMPADETVFANTLDGLRATLKHDLVANPMPGPPNSGRLMGGIRLVLCDRQNIVPNMSISERDFEFIEDRLNLHPTTLPAFCTHGGAYAMFTTKHVRSGSEDGLWLIVKAGQKNEIANWMISLYHDPRTGWTHAFVCGNAVLLMRDMDKRQYGVGQLKQLISALQDTPHLWDHPLLLPTILLGDYIYRTDMYTKIKVHELIEHENTLGYTMTGQHRPKKLKTGDLDVQNMTVQLHTDLTGVISMKSVCRWLDGCTTFLHDTDTKLAKTLFHYRAPLTGSDYRSWQHNPEIHQTLDFHASTIRSLVSSNELQRSRLDTQINLIFTLNSQMDNKLSFEVASSGKQDSISMTTFTFITALFLPGTFIATLFSMSMFNWHTDDSSSASGSNTAAAAAAAAATGSQVGNRYISDKFWIYWIFTIPLTVVTLAGWFLWYRFAKQKWQREIEPFRKGQGKSGAQRSEGVAKARARKDGGHTYAPMTAYG